MEPVRKTGSRSIFISELLLTARFGLVGILSTTLHVAIAWLLLSITTLPIIAANTLAFSIAFGFSFTGNYLWTFSAHRSARRAAFRFFLISISAFIFNSAILITALHYLPADPAFSAACSAMIIPIITFIASRLWCFN
ncbi:GtrA family protein [Thauera aromatica]|uniref:GtrA family protein n=1 Tax=Thauera aromatica TaxID=59405 RepID=UPI001FFCEC0D|nr:GtrA family protein [Thauera aromatica]MCK2087414.1 GtrA family protein [Thauera aromatica]